MMNMRVIAVFALFLLLAAPITLAESGSSADSNIQVNVDNDVRVVDPTSVRDTLRNEEQRKEARLLEERLRTEERLKDAQRTELKTRTEVKDGEVRERIELRNENIKERIDARVETRAQLARNDIREKVRTDLREKFDRLPPAAVSALEKNGRLEHVLENARVRMATEFENAKREIRGEVKIRSEAKREEAKSRFAERKQEYESAESEFKNKKQALAECTENCDELRAQVHAAARTSLVGAIDAVLDKIDESLARIEGAEDLSEDQAAEMTSKLETLRTKVEDLRSKAESAEDGQAVAAVAHELGGLMQEARVRVQTHETQVRGEKMLSALKKAERIDARMQCTVDAGADLDLDAYEGFVADAREAMENARTAHEDGDEETARGYIADAAAALKSARAEFESIRAVVKEQNLAVEDCEVAEVEERFDADVQDDVDKELAEVEEESEDVTDMQAVIEEDTDATETEVEGETSETTDEAEVENETEDETEVENETAEETEVEDETDVESEDTESEEETQ